ncbi:glycine cleavage system aminomethyltransferase GcvT [Aerophototrophica crusticola]
MVPFAGYDMPVQYPMGVLKEHLHTRHQAGLFDVSHMGQVRLRGASVEAVIAALEALVPGDVAALAPGRIRYTMFTDAQGGILDDLMVTRFDDHVYVVINAGRKRADLAHMAENLPGVEIEYLGDDAGLLALQGPAAATVMARLVPGAEAMPFMSATTASINGIPVQFSRSGYTGEDGFEISVAARDSEALARLLLAQPEVAPIGLGARDSLRLEAGLCLYGHDIDETTTPIEAGLAWTISKRRRAEGGFLGAAIIQAQLQNGTTRKRVGILPEGRQPAREHTDIQDQDGRVIGQVTSGGFGPTANGPVAMGYVATAQAAVGTPVNLIVRGKPLAAKVAAMPFAPHRYFKG